MRPDAVLGDLPLVYPFLVNDPGEGTQAKRRAHATLVDHLVPPMARADTYGDIARLEQLLDEHANIAAMDPAKLPAIRAQIWTLIQAAKLDHDLGLDDRPEDEGFDDFLLHVDGWLCEVKDAQIRDGLHVLGAAPAGDGAGQPRARHPARPPDLGRVRACPACARRSAWTSRPRDGAAPDAARAEAKAAPWSRRWSADATGTPAPTSRGGRPRVGRAVPGTREGPRGAGFAARGRPPAAATTDELARVLHALNGGFVPAGPSGSPLRGLVNVLPTGRNFYSVDPKAIPRRLAWETGQALADSLLERYRADTTASAPRRSGCRCGAPARCAPPATTSPRPWRCSASARSGTRPPAA